ncbi:MAG: hypothetical protein AB7G04_04220, partial [Hyphomonadaceae bacterium]
MTRGKRLDALEDEHFSRSGGALAVLFGAAPFVALGGAAALAAGGGLAGLLAVRWQRLPRALGGGGLPLALAAAFLVWAAASALWAPGRPLAQAAGLAAAALGLLLLVLGAGLVRAVDQAMARRAGAAGLGALVALLAIETAFDFPIGRQLTPGADPSLALEHARRALTLGAFWIWGVAAMLTAWRWPGWALTAVAVAGLVWLGARMPDAEALAALAAGAVPALLALRWPRGAVSITAMTAAFCFTVAPSVLPTAATLAGQAYRALLHVEPPFQWLARVDTWSFVSARISERPILGWGFGASGHFSETHVLQGFTVPYVAGHPSNAAMQIWLETGLIGALLFSGALAAFGRRAGAA